MKRFWTFIKHKRTNNSGITPLKEHDKLINDPAAQAAVLNRQFQSVFTKDKPLSLKQLAENTIPPQRFPIMKDFTVTTSGIEKLLCGVNPAKAAGPDGTSPRVMKELSSIIAPSLTTIYKIR